MIYFIVTTCIIDDSKIRENQYIRGISALKKCICTNNIQESKIIIVENNGLRNTFLDDLSCSVLYTENNSMKTHNKGVKELQDILDVIRHYNISDDDFIVKLTGRYIIHENSPFINALHEIRNRTIDSIIMYGWWQQIKLEKEGDCITGLIGMKCKYIKLIKPIEHGCIEWEWANVTYLIDDKNIIILDKLGIDISPGSNTYISI